MKATIRVRRGRKENLPKGGTLLGELFYCYDTKEFAISNGIGSDYTIVNESSNGDSVIKDWKENADYNVNNIVVYKDLVYRCKIKHTSGTTFDSANWQQLTTSEVGNNAGSTYQNFKTYASYDIDFLSDESTNKTKSVFLPELADLKSGNIVNVFKKLNQYNTPSGIFPFDTAANLGKVFTSDSVPLNNDSELLIDITNKKFQLSATEFKATPQIISQPLGSGTFFDLNTNKVVTRISLLRN